MNALNHLYHGFIEPYLLHLDKQLGVLIHDYGTWTYLILFTVIFCETGLVVTPFLPGDSLLFAAGTLAGEGHFHVGLLLAVLAAAAVLGDNVNYWIGRYIGPRAFSGEVRLLKQEYLDRTHRFFEKYGGMTIILARFVPIIRTFAPFVAGVGTMNYGRFLLYDVPGGIAWVSIFVWAGWLLGSLTWVQDHFSVVILVIVVISVLPMAIELARARFRPDRG